MKTIVTIKLTTIPTEEETLMLNEFIKSEVLLTKIKEEGRKRYLELLEEVVDVSKTEIEIDFEFVEDNQ